MDPYSLLFDQQALFPATGVRLWPMLFLFVAFGVLGESGASLRAAEPLALAGLVQETTAAFSAEALRGWTVVDGNWEPSPIAEQGSNGWIVVQKAVQNPFNVLVMPGPAYADVDVSVRFKPLSGQEDASGGIVFRFDRGSYYVIRANALEDNFRLYSFDGSRHQLASAHVVPPSLGAWHDLRVIAVGERIQGYLDGRLVLDAHDGQFKAGRVGLWTKADSVTAFQALRLRGVVASN
jgi:hypothetical protein